MWDPEHTTSRIIRCPDCGHLVARIKAEERFAAFRHRTRRYDVYVPADKTFGSFRTSGVAASVLEGYRAAHEFALAPRGFLVLLGANGTGKTHLAFAVVNHQQSKPAEQRPLWLAFTAPDLLDMLRSGYEAGDYAELLGLCSKVELLLIDDLGVESGTAWANEKLFQIINHRYQRELATVFTSNSRLENLPPRIADRLAEPIVSRVVLMVGNSYRQGKLVWG